MTPEQILELALRWVADGEDIEYSYRGAPWRLVSGDEVLQRLLNDGEDYPENKFRIKPKMIKCGTMEFPAPVGFSPDKSYYSVLVTVENNTTIAGFHETTFAAESHAKALISLTVKK